jgi:hypothetical protein
VNFTCEKMATDQQAPTVSLIFWSKCFFLAKDEGS